MHSGVSNECRDLTVSVARGSATKKLADKIFPSSFVTEYNAQTNTGGNDMVKFNLLVKGKK